LVEIVITLLTEEVTSMSERLNEFVSKLGQLETGEGFAEVRLTETQVQLVRDALAHLLGEPVEFDSHLYEDELSELLDCFDDTTDYFPVVVCPEEG
jgi:hypothetical protein